jgi:hypothetical protein
LICITDCKSSETNFRSVKGSGIFSPLPKENLSV